MAFQIISQADIPNHKATGFISVYKPIAGWKAVQYWWNPDMGGFWEPYQTSDFAFSEKEKAQIVAQHWAKSEDIPYCPGHSL